MGTPRTPPPRTVPFHDESPRHYRFTRSRRRAWKCGTCRVDVTWEDMIDHARYHDDLNRLIGQRPRPNLTRTDGGVDRVVVFEGSLAEVRPT